MPLLLTYKGNVKGIYAQASEDTLNSFKSQTPQGNAYLMSRRWNALGQKWKTVKIISKWPVIIIPIKKLIKLPKDPKGAILQGQQQLQQTATHNTSNTKQENGFIKIGKF